MIISLPVREQPIVGAATSVTVTGKVVAVRITNRGQILADLEVEGPEEDGLEGIMDSYLGQTGGVNPVKVGGTYS